MLSRLIFKPSHLRLVTLISSKSHLNPQTPPHHHAIFHSLLRPLSTNRGDNGNNGNNDPWKLSRESEGKFDAFFAEDSGNLAGIADGDSPAGDDDSWLKSKDEDDGDVFTGIDKEETVAEKRDGNGGGGGDEWLTAEGYKPWSLADEEKEDVFDLGDVARNVGETRVESSDDVEIQKIEEKKQQLEKEEKALAAIVKGPDRAFGDLISASGITDEMLDSLIALKDFQGVDGLPPLTDIQDERYERSIRKSPRAEIERQKQEDVAKSRVRQVDEKGKAYGTGRRKCSIARVWIQPGDGKFLVNDKEFDVYFPVLDHRAALLRPFSETKTLGLWDINCTVKGGGVSGQVGAVQLGISRALQNWEPDLRPPLRSAGFLTRDSRVVERKKPGKAKARKSFQWVKR